MAYEFGDTAKFAVRFDDNTGNLTEIVYKGEPITIPGGGDQRFDIMQDNDWMFWKGKLKLIKIEKISDAVVRVIQETGDWQAAFNYTVDVDTATLKRSAELTYRGNNEHTKIRNFWMSLPTFPFKGDAEFFIPGQYPSKKYNAENFAENERKGSMRNSAPLVFQWDKSKSIILLSDNLVDYADNPNNGIERRDGGVRLTQSYNVLGYIKPNTVIKLGDSCFRVIDGDSETALLKIHDLMRDMGHVPPADRPKW
ncbi:MAG: hypothetical protein LBN39_03810, partial [Planctomycetaceae bacterium]|nr:hypothetical protein [Planctomycetaceae bacterium]